MRFHCCKFMLSVQQVQVSIHKIRSSLTVKNMKYRSTHCPHPRPTNCVRFQIAERGASSQSSLIFHSCSRPVPDLLLLLSWSSVILSFRAHGNYCRGSQTNPLSLPFFLKSISHFTHPTHCRSNRVGRGSAFARNFTYAVSVACDAWRLGRHRMADRTRDGEITGGI